ncbi:c-type cytochrome [Roseateles sp.]|uniref:c-type cytochrome n=1 Tax=Roseateles sp. TaxID=1971397 RepID=UPI0025CC5F79|nr:c-type cytochrome [Roseateles sp.]MBV8036239.1 c-type cytochrome [Roseateles sp.]
MRPRALLPLVLAGLAGGVQGQPGGGNAAAGRSVYAACIHCHQIGPVARNAFGPPLNGIVGRRAGRMPGYAYSSALKAADIVWTEERLAAFIRDPSGVVPGTKMRFWGVGLNERKLADLMAYLRTVPADGSAQTHVP